MARERDARRVFRIAFLNEGKLYEIYARAVASGDLLGFVEVEGLLFGERTGVVVDPSEERLRSEFEGVERTFIPIHAIVRIDQVRKRGPAKISAAPGGTDKVRSLPTSLLVPGKREPCGADGSPMSARAPDWGIPPWEVGAAVPPVSPPARVDVAVVGAGLTGLSAAWHLARRGVRVAVLEAAHRGAGASGRTGGIVLEGTAVGPLEDVDACLPALERVVAEAGIACHLRLDGCWELVHRAAPGTLPPLWRDGAATLCIAGREPGGSVDAGALVAGLARAALAAGATLHEGTPVLAVERDRLVLARGTLAAGHVVLAVNAYTPALLPLPASLSPALTFALATRPLGDETLAAIGLAARTPFYTVDLPYLWGRVLEGGQLVCGAGLAFPPDGIVAHAALAEPEAAAALARLEARVRGLHPALAGVAIESRWAGPIAFRGNRAPILGWHPEAPRVVVTGGYAGHGVALAVRAGALVAAAIADGRALPGWGALDAAG